MSNSGFRSGGRAFGAGVVERPAASGAVWVRRGLRAGARAPGAWCIPLACPPALAGELAAAVARAVPAGYRVYLRPARRTSGAPNELKVLCPVGCSAGAARSALAAAGLFV